jgi:hypothetical protein
VAKEVVETIKSEREPRSRGLVMTTNKLLTLAEVGEIEGRRLRVIDKANPSKLAEAALTIHEDIPALCATVRELAAERLEVQRILAATALEDPTEDDDPPYSSAELVEGVCFLTRMKDAARARTKALRNQLAAAERERDGLREELGRIKTVEFPDRVEKVRLANVESFRTRAINLCREKAATHKLCHPLKAQGFSEAADALETLK